MLLLNEFVTYIIKFIVLGVTAVAGVVAGTKYKKSKLEKNAVSQQNNNIVKE